MGKIVSMISVLRDAQYTILNGHGVSSVLGLVCEFITKILGEMMVLPFSQ